VLEQTLMVDPRDPEEATAAAAPTLDASIPAGTTMGAVHLTVAELERSLTYYTREIGLEVLEQTGRRASLGAGATELVMARRRQGDVARLRQSARSSVGAPPCEHGGDRLQQDR
jgi:catechol-2,3-dioxygenase